MNQEKIGNFIAQLRVKYGYMRKEIGEVLGIIDNSFLNGNIVVQMAQK